MTIYDAQYKKLLSQMLMESFIKGRNPNIVEITNRLQKLLNNKGKITYKYYPQASREKFNIFLYNKSLNQIKFDIDLFYEELLNLINKYSNRVAYSDIYNKVNIYFLEKLKSELDNLLFVTSNADFYFEGAFDSFSSLEKTNIEESTPDVIDLSEGALSLPPHGGHVKVDLSHLNDAAIWPIQITTSEENIVSKEQVAGTEFSNIFKDTLSHWGYEVISKRQEPVELEFAFSLGNGEIEYFVNRIEIIPQATSPFNISIKVSTDNVTYKSLSGYENGVTLSSQKKVHAMDFETNLIQFVKVKLRKEFPDSEVIIDGQKRYQYIFGLKNIALYKLGRASVGTYISKPFTFTKPISKVSLSSVSEVPVSTNVTYSIGIPDSGGAYSFSPISSLEKPSVYAPNVIEIGKSTRNSLTFSVPTSGDDAPSLYGTFSQGKSFYRVGPKVEPTPEFGTAKLYRGKGGWFRDASSAFNITEVKDSYISFAQSNIESFYAVKKESARFSISPGRQIALSLNSPPYYNNERGHLLKPDPSFQQAAIDARPNYAIYSVQQLSDINRRTIRHTLTTDRVQELPVTNINMSPAGLPAEVVDPSLNIRYVEGKDYVIEYQLIGNVRKSTGRMSIPDGSALLNSSGQVLSGITLNISYTPDIDITHKVISIVDNTVNLENCIIQYGESILVEYRFIPSYPNEIIKATIRVSDNLSSASSINYYVEGTDYIVDPATAAIQRLANGNIGNNDSVYVSFSYRNSETGIETFQTWVYLPSTTEIRLDADPSLNGNRLIADKEIGEAFFINSPLGFLDITSSLTIPEIPQGWVQFIVRSKNPDLNSNYRNNLIDQVIQLRDTDKKKVFKLGGKYFSEITAFREPMAQKTLNHLKVNTLKTDHSFFAIDRTTDPNSSYIVLNFKPNETVELYNRIASDESEEDTRPESVPEIYTISWVSKNQSFDTYTIIVKIQLERNRDSKDGGITPKVFEYNIRVGN